MSWFRRKPKFRVRTWLYVHPDPEPKTEYVPKDFATMKQARAWVVRLKRDHGWPLWVESEVEQLTMKMAIAALQAILPQEADDGRD